MVKPSRPNVTRLSDKKVMLRWFVPSPADRMEIKFFKVQYRMGESPKSVKNTNKQWITENDDIQPNVLMHEVNNLKPEHYYRFRIVAVFSNDDHMLGNASKIFLLQSAAKLDPKNSHLPAPNLTSVEPVSEDAVVLHWILPGNNDASIDGFYVFYRPASTAGEYSMATVEGMDTRGYRIDNLETGTPYEFKIQSYTASAASEFMAIITGKTLSKFIELFPFGELFLFYELILFNNYVRFYTISRTIDTIADRSQCCY